MKLLYCKTCGDIRKLFTERPSICYCGASKGAYKTDGLNAWHSGPSKMLGIANYSFGCAVVENEENPPTTPFEKGHRFDAFVIPDVAPTVEKLT